MSENKEVTDLVVMTIELSDAVLDLQLAYIARQKVDVGLVEQIRDKANTLAKVSGTLVLLHGASEKMTVDPDEEEGC